MIAPLHKKNGFRNGLTLVELLVVVGVASVITAIVLPSIKTILTDRKSSQTAIIVKNFFEAARARAIGKNRTVAVVIERLSSRTEPGTPFVSATANATPTAANDNFLPYNACVRLSLSEEPLPFRESMLPFSVTFFPRSPIDGLVPAFPDVAYVDEDSVQDSHGGNEVRAFRVSGNASALAILAPYLIAGAEISFENSSRRFTIVSPRSASVHNDYLSAGGGIWFAVVNEIAADDSAERASAPYVPFLPSETSGFANFKIYSRPKPIFSETIQLPRGMCIDLSLSGFSSDTLRSVPLPPLTRPIFDPPGTVIAHPLSDYRARFASDWIGNGTVPAPPLLRPVYIAFTPDGNLSHVWANERSGANLARIDATQDIFLHIGKIDQIVLPVDDISMPGGGTVRGRNKKAYLNAMGSNTKQNLSDLNSYVVRLSPKSGSITASPAVSIETQIQILGLNPDNLSLGDFIELSRRGTYSTNVTSQ